MLALRFQEVEPAVAQLLVLRAFRGAIAGCIGFEDGDFVGAAGADICLIALGIVVRPRFNSP